MIRLRTSDGGLDIAPDLGVTIEYNSPLFGSVGDLTKDYTYPAQVRTSPNNSLLLQFAQRPEVRSWPTDTVALLYNDVPLLTGQLELIRATESTLDVSIRKAGAAPFMSQPLNELERALFPVNIGDPFNQIVVEWPRVKVDFFTGSPVIVNDGQTLIDFQYPFPYVRSTLEELIKPYGWTVDFLWDPILDTLLIFLGRRFFFPPGSIILDGRDLFFPELTYEQFLDSLSASFDLAYTIDPIRKVLTIEQAQDWFRIKGSRTYEAAPGWEKDVYEKQELLFRYPDPNPVLTSEQDPNTVLAYRALYDEFGSGDEQTAKALFLPNDTNAPNYPYYGGTTLSPNSPLILMFYNSATTSASYIAPGGVVDMRWESLVPYFWQGRLSATASASVVKRTLLMDVNELNQFDIRRKVYHQGVLYQPQRLRVNIPARPVHRFRGEATMLVI